MSGASPGKPRGSLHGQLSLATLGSGAVDLNPVLRAALHTQPSASSHGSGSVTFAARAALDPADPEASLELFRRLRRRQAAAAQSAAAQSAAVSPAAPPAGLAAQPASRPAEGAQQRGGEPFKADAFASDSARHSEAGGAATPASPLSPQASVDAEGSWRSPAVEAPAHQLQQLPLGPPAAEPGSDAGDGASKSPFAAAAGAADGRALASLSSEALALHGAHTSSAPPRPGQPLSFGSTGGGGGGADTPRSFVSWASGPSGSLALPQHEVELLGLSDAELERLAAEAAEVQALAATALRLARDRLGARGGGGGGRAAAMGEAGAGGAGESASFAAGGGDSSSSAAAGTAAAGSGDDSAAPSSTGAINSTAANGAAVGPAAGPMPVGEAEPASQPPISSPPSALQPDAPLAAVTSSGLAAPLQLCLLLAAALQALASLLQQARSACVAPLRVALAPPLLGLRAAVLALLVTADVLALAPALLLRGWS